jgi:hypothetical protein
MKDLIKAVLGFLFIGIGFLFFLFFGKYKGNLIPYPVFGYIVGILLMVLGYLLVKSGITLNNKKEKQNFNSEIDRFKQSADKIKVNLSDCEILSNNYTEQVEKVKSYKAQALDSIYDSGKNIEQVDINQTVIVYKTTQYGQKEQFNSSTINKDRITLNFLLAKHKETYLYVDRNNRQKYYFDIEFLND